MNFFGKNIFNYNNFKTKVRKNEKLNSFGNAFGIHLKINIRVLFVLVFKFEKLILYVQ